ncbi:MAG: hypothetical protein GY790_11635 [Bacteroidetes bacterium]|nr:hypothetical protein [Bacteroidota bacterium]
MKRLFLLFTAVALVISGHAQTVENIRVTQDGDQLKITYRIGASTESQLYNVFLSCSMAGGSRFEPKAVIGDVGENIIGGKSYYMVMWDVFEDVDEVIDPNITVRVDLVSDASAPAAAEVTRTTTEPVEKVQEEPVQEAKPSQTVSKEEDSREADRFRRNGFLSYSGMLGFGTPIGISFGSLNNWGYYVTPLRLGINSFDYYDVEWGSWEKDLDLHIMIAAGVTKHIVSAGFYRLHGYLGVGTHYWAENLTTEPVGSTHLLMETGLVNVIGGFNLTAGFSLSPGYESPVFFTFGIGFVF